MEHMLYAKSISWIDDCRIPFVDDGDKDSAKPQGKTLKHKGWDTDKWLQDTIEPHNQGRFPANILVSDDMLNDGIISKTTSSKGHIRKGNVVGDNRTPISAGLFGDGNWIEGTNINDKGTNSRYYDIDKWFEKILNYE